MNGLGVLAVGTIVVLVLLLASSYRDLSSARWRVLRLQRRNKELVQENARLLDELDAHVAVLRTHAQDRHPSTSHLRVVR